MSRLRLDYAAIGMFARTSPELRAHLQSIVDKGAAFAKSIAPVGELGTGGAYKARPGRVQRFPGDYQRSLEGVIHHGRSRMSGRVQSKDFKAGWIEKGTRHMPKHAVLSRTLDYMKGSG